MLPVRHSQNWLPDLFNDFFTNDWAMPAKATAPAMNIMESEKAYTVELAAPGMTKEDFNICLDEDNNLVITMEKKQETPEKDKAGEKKDDVRYWRHEFCYSKFQQAISLPENTKAYAVSSVAGTQATLTEIAEAVPDATPVVLVNSEAASSVVCLWTDNATPYSGTNYLRGTFYALQLDLAEDNGLYSLGRLDDKIGFYKFDNNGTTTITLSANKAYLEVPASGSSVKGFTLGFGGDDGISKIVNSKSVNGTWYDLNGRRLSGEPAAKGVYITGGKKVVVK